ncbi:DUF1120 domain-containing protein [Enterobacter asburiae]|nr:DUF1120 domain-containing protein [Enterobacter asburiae]
MIKSTLAVAIIASGINTAFAESVDVKVNGTIIPAACTPALAGGGVVDYGNIKASTLSADDYTTLPEKEIDFSITCDALAKVALNAVNDRPGTMAGVTEGYNGAATTPVPVFGVSSAMGVGLGLDGTAKIGGYAVRLDPAKVTADGSSVDGIKNGGAGSTDWTGSPGSVFSNAPRYISWAKTGELTPVAFKVLAGKLGVQAYINKASELDLTHAIHLDGQTTLEVIYL